MSSSSSSSSSSADADVAVVPLPRWDTTGTGDCVFGGEGLPLEFGAFSSTTAVLAALALLIASENDIGGGVVAVAVVAFAVFVGVVVLLDATRPARPARPCRGGAPRSSGDDGGDGKERSCCCCCCCVFLVSGVARQDVLVVPSSSSSSSLIKNLSLLAPAPFLLLEKRDRTRAAPIAFRHRARGSKFSRRPERSCSVGQSKVVSHGCARACSAVRRRAGSGFSRARMKPFAVCTGAVVRVRFWNVNVHMTIPSSDTFFQYRSWKLILASVVCRTSSFMSSDRKGVYPQRSM